MNSMQDQFPLRPRSQPPRSGISARAVLGTSLLAFIGGGILIGWLAWNGRIDLGQSAAPRQQLAALPAPAPGPADSAKIAAYEQRVATLEQRLARIDQQAAASEGNTSRTEALLVVLAARRAVERGVALGYLGDQLKLRFADAQPDAVKAVLEAGARPISIEQLEAELDRLKPQLIDRPADEGGWDKVTRELSGLFEIRRDSAASSKPEDRLEQARLQLRAGNYGLAASEVERLPGAAAAKDWIAAARRHEAACRGLDLIETTALLDPERLKTSDGKPVAQPGPLAPHHAPVAAAPKTA